MDQHISLFYIPLIYFAPFLYVSIMSNSVRYIHTQAQAQAELQRLREVCRASAAAKKRRIEVDPDYARQLQANATERQQKHADRMRVWSSSMEIHQPRRLAHRANEAIR